jgi:hypothetical protein
VHYLLVLPSTGLISACLLISWHIGQFCWSWMGGYRYGWSWRTSTAGRSKRNSLGCSTTRRWSNWWLFLWSWASTLVDKKYPALIPHIRKRTNYTKGMSNTKTILIYVDIFS